MLCEYTGPKLHTRWGSYAETYGNYCASGSSNSSLVCFGSVTPFLGFNRSKRHLRFTLYEGHFAFQSQVTKDLQFYMNTLCLVLIRMIKIKTYLGVND